MKVLKAIKPFFGGVFLCVLAAVSGWYLRNESAFFIVQKTPFEISIPSGHRNVASRLKPEFEDLVGNIRSQNIWRVDLHGLKRSLMNHPWVREVNLQRRFPDEIAAHVVLENIVVNVMEDRQWVAVTSEGKKIVAPFAGALPDRPILKDADILQDPEKLSKFMKLYDEVPHQGVLSEDNIAEVRMEKVEGLTLVLLKENITVHLGREKISTKGLQVLRVTDYLKSQNQKARVIDASFNKKVLVRLRKRS